MSPHVHIPCAHPMCTSHRAHFHLLPLKCLKLFTFGILVIINNTLKKFFFLVNPLILSRSQYARFCIVKIGAVNKLASHIYFYCTMASWQRHVLKTYLHKVEMTLKFVFLKYVLLSRG